MRSFSPIDTQAILFGTSSYNDSTLTQIPAVKRNITALQQILTDPHLVGLESSHVTSICDPESPIELLRTVRSIANLATDTLFVYYAGHGLRPGAGRGFFLATKTTTQNDCEIDGINFDNIRSILARSPARKKILVLDCCFSGLAIQGAMGPAASALSADIDIQGTYSIASSPANKISTYSPGGQFTSFSGHLIDVLRNGIDKANEYLTLDDIYVEVRRRALAATALPEPQRQINNQIGGFLFSRNPSADNSVTPMIGEPIEKPPVVIEKPTLVTDNSHVFLTLPILRVNAIFAIRSLAGILLSLGTVWIAAQVIPWPTSYLESAVIGMIFGIAVWIGTVVGLASQADVKMYHIVRLMVSLSMSGLLLGQVVPYASSMARSYVWRNRPSMTFEEVDMIAQSLAWGVWAAGVAVILVAAMQQLRSWYMALAIILAGVVTGAMAGAGQALLEVPITVFDFFIVAIVWLCLLLGRPAEGQGSGLLKPLE